LAERDRQAAGRQRTPQNHLSAAPLFFVSHSLLQQEKKKFPHFSPEMDSLRQQSLIPSFLYSSSSSAKTFSLSSLHSEQPSLSPPPSSTVTMGSKSSGGFVIPAPSEPGKKIEMYSPAFYAACTAGGILSCGLTHMTVTPLDLVKCNMQVHFLLFSVVFSLDLCCYC